MPSVKCSVVYASPLLFYALPPSPCAELYAPRGSGTIEINSRVYERARKPRALECRAKIGGDLCSLATRGEPLQNSYPAGSPLGLAPLPNVRGGSLFALCRAITLARKVVRGSVLAATTRPPLSLRRATRFSGTLTYRPDY